jgi:hypothetical protein
LSRRGTVLAWRILFAASMPVCRYRKCDGAYHPQQCNDYFGPASRIRRPVLWRSHRRM